MGRERGGIEEFSDRFASERGRSDFFDDNADAKSFSERNENERTWDEGEVGGVGQRGRTGAKDFGGENLVEHDSSIT